ncbi:hypothetical protein [Gulbenkiania mobilis]|uniref:hypothetical protein n=1 Tax=Gulbenkiania mobilis TaxID=397457 RepID=UPI00128EC1B8|nr:hypothetical protein [Gulbenkiania mobilis]
MNYWVFEGGLAMLSFAQQTGFLTDSLYCLLVALTSGLVVALMCASAEYQLQRLEMASHPDACLCAKRIFKRIFTVGAPLVFAGELLLIMMA